MTGHGDDLVADAGISMTKFVFAFLCLMGAAVFAPNASAADMRTSAPLEAVVDEAPIEAPIAQDCRRRPGRMSFMRSCVAIDGDSLGGPSVSNTCARRVAYRGHRRVSLSLRACRPMFSSDRSAA